MPDENDQQRDDQQQQDDQQQDDQGDQGDEQDDPEVDAIRSDPVAAARTLAKARAEAAEYRRKLRTVEQERDELRRAGLDETERAVAEAEARGRAAADSEYARRTLEAEIRAAAAGKLQDPADAVRYLNLDDLTDADERELARVVAKLVEDKPYLAVVNGDQPAPTKGVPRTSQGPRTQPGAKQSSDADGDAWIRKAAGRSSR